MSLPGHPGHSSCAFSLQVPNAPCAFPVDESDFASPSAHVSPSLHSVYAGRPSVARYWLIVSTHSVRSAAYASPPVPFPSPPASAVDESLELEHAPWARKTRITAKNARACILLA